MVEEYDEIEASREDAEGVPPFEINIAVEGQLVHRKNYPVRRGLRIDLEKSPDDLRLGLGRKRVLVVIKDKYGRHAAAETQFEVVPAAAKEELRAVIDLPPRNLGITAKAIPFRTTILGGEPPFEFSIFINGVFLYHEANVRNRIIGYKIPIGSVKNSHLAKGKDLREHAIVIKVSDKVKKEANLEPVEAGATFVYDIKKALPAYTKGGIREIIKDITKTGNGLANLTINSATEYGKVLGRAREKTNLWAIERDMRNIIPNIRTLGVNLRSALKKGAKTPLMEIVTPLANAVDAANKHIEEIRRMRLDVDTTRIGRVSGNIARGTEKLRELIKRTSSIIGLRENQLSMAALEDTLKRAQ